MFKLVVLNKEYEDNTLYSLINGRPIKCVKGAVNLGFKPGKLNPAGFMVVLGECLNNAGTKSLELGIQKCNSCLQEQETVLVVIKRGLVYWADVYCKDCADLTLQFTEGNGG